MSCSAVASHHNNSSAAQPAMRLLHAEQSKSSAAQPASGDATPLYHSFVRSLEGAPCRHFSSNVIHFMSEHCFFGEILQPGLVFGRSVYGGNEDGADVGDCGAAAQDLSQDA